MAKYKPKHIGLRVTLTVPDFVFPVLDVMDNTSIGIVIREAMRSTGRPAAVALKNLLKQDLSASEQSTGATERAVAVKYGRSKSNPAQFYVMVGIDTTHTEFHRVAVEGQITKIRRGRKQRGAGLFAQQFRRNSKGRISSKQVFSRYRDTNRINKLKGAARKVRPKKYFHLIDKGFNHRFAGRVDGYEFIQKLQTSLGNSMQKIFEDRLNELIIPTIEREMIRKFKSVL